VTEAGHLALDFMAKSIGIRIFWFEYIFRCYRDTKTAKTLLAVLIKVNLFLGIAMGLF